MSETLERIRAALAAHDVGSHAIAAGHGQLLLADRGARIVGCALQGVHAGNLFWHHPALESADTAGVLLQAGSGDVGGDRLWIAPEVAYMWPDLAAARTDPVGTYVLPREMDPSQWQVLEQGVAHVIWGAGMRLTDHRTGRGIELEVTRHVQAIDRPTDLDASIACASFAIRNDLVLLDGDDGAMAGGWDLLQVPPTGTLICPTAGRVDSPRSYYEPFGDKHVQSDARAVRFLIDAKRRVKMGLRPEDTLGRMGYYRPLGGGQSSLILRMFAVMPGETYVDLPRSSDVSFGGDALQAYNEGEGGAAFGEMEYHDPAIVVGCGPQTRSGSSVTHAMVGPDEAIRTVGEALLGAAIEAIG